MTASERIREARSNETRKCPECESAMVKRGGRFNSWDCEPCNLVYIKVRRSSRV